jgi:hypothetical protein
MKVEEGLPEVSYAKTHTAIFVPTFPGKTGGDYKNTLTAGNEGPDKQMKMYIHENGLLMITGKGVPVLIPFANVTHMVLKPL